MNRDDIESWSSDDQDTKRIISSSFLQNRSPISTSNNNNANNNNNNKSSEIFRRKTPLGSKGKMPLQTSISFPTLLPLPIRSNGTTSAVTSSIEKEEDGSWQCLACTLINERNNLCCNVCMTQKPTDVEHRASWICNKCTLDNDEGLFTCAACGTLKPMNSSLLLPVTRPSPVITSTETHIDVPQLPQEPEKKMDDGHDDRGYWFKDSQISNETTTLTRSFNRTSNADNQSQSQSRIRIHHDSDDDSRNRHEEEDNDFDNDDDLEESEDDRQREYIEIDDSDDDIEDFSSIDDNDNDNDNDDHPFHHTNSSSSDHVQEIPTIHNVRPSTMFLAPTYPHLSPHFRSVTAVVSSGFSSLHFEDFTFSNSSISNLSKNYDKRQKMREKKDNRATRKTSSSSSRRKSSSKTSKTKANWKFARRKSK